jgi:hypothetical protein
MVRLFGVGLSYCSSSKEMKKRTFMPCCVFKIYDKEDKMAPKQKKPGCPSTCKRQKSTARAKGKEKKREQNRNMPTPQSSTMVGLL